MPTTIAGALRFKRKKTCQCKVTVSTAPLRIRRRHKRQSRRRSRQQPRKPAFSPESLDCRAMARKLLNSNASGDACRIASTSMAPMRSKED